MKTITVSFTNKTIEMFNIMNEMIFQGMVIILKPTVQLIYKKYHIYKKASGFKKKVMKRMFVKKIATIAALSAIGIAIALGASFFEQKASAHEAEMLHKYYTSITVQPGDTLWSISEDNYGLGYNNRVDYISEVMHINHLKTGDEIISGTSLVIPYYSEEVK